MTLNTQPASPSVSTAQPGLSSRRDFMKEAATAVAVTAWGATIVPARVLGREGATPPSEKIVLGIIGIGPRCRYDLSSILPFGDVQCVALADVQASRRDSGKEMIDKHYGNHDCQVHRDFRELLARPEIDAVLVATGDRWHAAASILAAQAGKDIYSEKPCGITIEACQQLAETIHREQRIFQAGTQRRSVANFQAAVKLAQSGKLGKLKTLHASIYVPRLENTWLPQEPAPSRDVVDWNLWLGPAPWRPFNQKYVDGAWRKLWDFDSGASVLDWGAHTVDLCQWANQSDETMPVTYEPLEDRILCTYANGVQLSIDYVKAAFKDHGPSFQNSVGTCPVRFEGEEGWVETGDNGELLLSSEALKKEVGETNKRVRGLDVGTHARNFFDCIRNREKPVAHQDVMRRSHLACHAAALSWILQRKLTLDPVKEEFVNDAEANGLRSRPFRNWTV